MNVLRRVVMVVFGVVLVSITGMSLSHRPADPSPLLLYATRDPATPYYTLYRAQPDGSSPHPLATIRLSGADTFFGRSPDGQWLYFRDLETGQTSTGIYRMRPDGSQQQQLTGQPGNEFNPDLSPDGRWIYYNLQYRTEHGLWRVRTDGSVVEAVVEEPSVMCCFSHDGQSIFFRTLDNDRLFQARPDGSGRQLLQEQGVQNRFLPAQGAQARYSVSIEASFSRWYRLDVPTGEIEEFAVQPGQAWLLHTTLSPDEQWLLVDMEEATPTAYIIPTQPPYSSLALHPDAALGLMLEAAIWTPDSRFLLASFRTDAPVSAENTLAVYRLDPVTRSRTLITLDLPNAHLLAVAPDGAWALVYRLNQSLGTDVYRVAVEAADTGDFRSERLGSLPGQEPLHPEGRSPDGEWFYFRAAGKDGEGQLFRVNLAAGQMQAITHGPGDKRLVDWLPLFEMGWSEGGLLAAAIALTLAGLIKRLPRPKRRKVGA